MDLVKGNFAESPRYEADERGMGYSDGALPIKRYSGITPPLAIGAAVPHITQTR